MVKYKLYIFEKIYLKKLIIYIIEICSILNLLLDYFNTIIQIYPGNLIIYQKNSKCEI